MHFIACGVNHQTAAIALREQAALSREHAATTLQSLLQARIADEAMILSTCNRTDVYSYTADPQRLMTWLAQQPRIGTVVGSPHWYCYQGQQAAGHVMRVASGLDSKILGEPQVFGQLKQAFALAQQVGAIGGYLQRLVQRVFAVSKHVRSASGIGVAPVTLAYAVITLAKRIFADLTKCRVLLIGGGQIMELMALHLADQGIKRLVVANRSLNKAQHLASPFHGVAIGLADIPLYLAEADIVIAATNSFAPLLTHATVTQTLRACSKRRAVLMVDLGVPRDIDPEVGALEDVYLYNIDQIGSMISENLRTRYGAAQQAEAMIELQARFFMRQLQELDAVDTICAYRDRAEQLRNAELSDAVHALQTGKAPQAVLTELAHALTNKLLHHPTVQLRQAAFDGDKDTLIAARKLFNL